jgi:hypothetical protein
VMGLTPAHVTIDDRKGLIEIDPIDDDPAIFRVGAPVRFIPAHGPSMVGKTTSRRTLKNGRIRLRVLFDPDPRETPA